MKTLKTTISYIRILRHNSFFCIAIKGVVMGLNECNYIIENGVWFCHVCLFQDWC